MLSFQFTEAFGSRTLVHISEDAAGCSFSGNLSVFLLPL